MKPATGNDAPPLIGLEEPLFCYFARGELGVPDEELAACLAQHRQSGGRLGEIFRGRGVLTREQVA
jgi:hypothetical protein